jgi:hypothetical protein
MSRRTSEASKAIRKAWEYEKQLVSDGKGTRDWTKEQQQDILDKGKAYDDDGKAFEGHHMKSAEAYPDYQGNSDNIQFLTRAEHKDAHEGNFQNSTNGYYDPSIRLTTDFGNGAPVPCKIVELSKPISVTGINENEVKINKLDQQEQKERNIEDSQSDRLRHKKQVMKQSGGKESIICKMVRIMGDFEKKHPILTKGIKLGGFITFSFVGSAAAIHKSQSSNSTGSGYSSDVFYQTGKPEI